MQYLRPLVLPILGRLICARELVSEDIPELYEIDSDPDVKRYLNGPVISQRDEWIKRMRSLCGRTTTLAVADLGTNVLVGRAALAPTELHRSVVDLEIVLGKAVWGRKVGREVAGLLIDAAWSIGASAVAAKAHPSNTASIALLTALGFESTGPLASAGWDDGFIVFSLEAKAAE